MFKDKNRCGILFKTITIGLVCLFLVNNIVFALELKSPTVNSALAPNSIFTPVVILKWNDSAKQYDIIENKTEKQKFIQGYREDAAFVYLNVLIGQFVNGLAELRKLGMSKRGIKEHLAKFIESIKKNLPHINFDRFLFEKMYWDNNAICLPYVRKDTGEQITIRLPIEFANQCLPQNDKTEKPGTFKPLNQENEKIVRWVISQYNLGEILSIESLKPQYVFMKRLLVLVTLKNGQKVVIKEYDESPAQLTYMFWIQDLLAQKGYKTPRAFPNKQGTFFVRKGNYPYAVMEYVDGVQGAFRPPLFQRIQSARLLVQFHNLLRYAQPPGEPNVAGYFDEAGYYDEFEMNEKRMENLLLDIKTCGPPYNDIEAFILGNEERIRYHFKESAQLFPREQYERIKKNIINGDFSPSNQIISGHDPRAGDIISIVDYKPSPDLRSRDFMNGFEAPSPGETTKTTLARFTALYQLEAIRQGFPLSEEEIRFIPEVYRISRLHNLTWIAAKGKISQLISDIAQGYTTEYEFYKRKMQQLTDDFGVPGSPVSWDDFPALVHRYTDEYKQKPERSSYDIPQLVHEMVTGGSRILLPYAPETKTCEQNELLILIKPDHEYTAESLKYVFERLSRFGYDIVGARVLEASDFENEDLTRKNYPLIYAASHFPDLLREERERLRSFYDKEEFIRQFGVAFSEVPVIPAAWLVERYGLSPDDVVDLWYNWKINDPDWKRFLTGHPCGTNIIGDHKAVYPTSHPKVNEGKPFFMMSGHFMDLKYHIFERKGARTIAVAVRATSAKNASWKAMREEYLGKSDPSKGRPDSMRRDAWEKKIPELRGVTDVTRNFLHMSNGPVAAAGEIAAFFRTKPEDTTFGALLTRARYTPAEILEFTNNPKLYSAQQETNLFDLTRELDAIEAFRVIRELFPPYYGHSDSPPGVTLEKYRELQGLYRQGKLSKAKNKEQLVGEKIRPLSDIAEFPSIDSDAYKALETSGKDLIRRGRVAQLIMSGGTSGRMFGYEKDEAERIRGFAKALTVDGKEYDFFALKLMQLQNLNRETGSVIPVYFQVIQKNERNVIEGLRHRNFYGYDRSAIRFFTTGLMPRMHLNRDDLASADLSSYPLTAEPAKWAGSEFRFSNLKVDGRAMGHLDGVITLWLTKTLLRMAEEGIEYLDIVDPGDIGAILDPALIAHFAGSRAGILSLVAKRDPLDSSRGAPYDLNGHPVIIEGYQLPETYQKTETPYQASIHYLFKISSLLEFFGVKSLEEYRSLSREELYRRSEEATAGIPFGIEVKNVNDGGVMRPTANCIRSVADLTRIIPTGIISIDRKGERTRVGFIPHKTTSDIIRQVAVSEKFARSRILGDSSTITHQTGYAKSDLQKTLSGLLRESLYEIPYNSYATAMDVLGYPTPISFGGNCVYQVKMLRQKIEKVFPGIPVAYLIDDRHHSLLVGTPETGLFYLNPYLMQLEAAPVPLALGSVEVPAFPSVFGQMGKVLLERTSDGLIVKKFIFNKYISDSPIQTHRFQFNLNTSLSDQHHSTKDKNFAIHPEVSTLSIRGITASGEMIAYVYSLTKKQTYIINPYGQKIFSQEKGEFNRWFQILLDLLSVSRDDFLNYAQRGLGAYMSLAASVEIDFQYPNAVNAVDVAPSRMVPQKIAPPHWLYYVKVGSEEEDRIGKPCSYLKMGRFEEVKYYSAQMTEKIRQSIGERLEKETGEWVIGNIGGTGIPNDAYLLAREVAKQLNLPHILMQTRKRGDPALIDRYTSLRSSEERKLTVEGTLGIRDVDIHLIQGKKVILIDDALVAGVLVAEAEKVLLKAGAKFVAPYFVAVFDGLGDHEFENRMNRKALARDPIGVMSSVLNDERSAYTTALLKFCFELNPADFASLLDKMTLSAKLNLYLYSVEFFSQRSPQTADLLVDQIEKETGVRFPASSFLRQIRSKSFFDGVGAIIRERGYRIKVEDAKEILKKMQQLLEATSETIEASQAHKSPDLEREKNIAIDFRDAVINRALGAKKENQYIILGLDTSWILNMSGPQGIISALEELPTILRQKGLDNVVFERGNGDEVAVKIQQQRLRTNANFSNIIILGSQSILRSTKFNELKGETPEDSALLIAIDTKNLTYTSAIRIIEMFLLAEKLDKGKLPSELDKTFIDIKSVEGRARAFIFTPIEPYDIEQFREINRMQIEQIGSKA